MEPVAKRPGKQKSQVLINRTGCTELHVPMMLEPVVQKPIVQYTEYIVRWHQFYRNQFYGIPKVLKDGTSGTETSFTKKM